MKFKVYKEGGEPEKIVEFYLKEYHDSIVVKASDAGKTRRVARLYSDGRAYLTGNLKPLFPFDRFEL